MIYFVMGLFNDDAFSPRSSCEWIAYCGRITACTAVLVYKAIQGERAKCSAVPEHHVVNWAMEHFGNWIIHNLEGT